MSDPLPTVGILFSVQVVLACLRRGDVADAELVLRELAHELLADAVAETVGEAQYSTFQ